jgi:2-dehydropantoate 2-reductase
MIPIKKVCVFGVGGVGGYFGAKIAAAINKMSETGFEVYFIARGKHLKAIEAHGLTVVSPERTLHVRPTIAVDDIRRIPPPDMILLCVKCYDLAQALAAMQSQVKKNTPIIALLNGVDIHDRIRAELSMGVVLPACVYVGTHIDHPGVIHHSGGDGKILFGQDPDKQDFSTDQIKRYFENVGIAYDFAHDPFPVIWEKYMFIAAFGLVTAHTGKSVGQVAADKESEKLLRSVMLEIVSIAEKKKIRLPEDIISNSIAKANRFPFSAKTSYQRDIEQKGYLNEGDLYGGTIIRQGQALGIPTPVTERIYSQIQKEIGA